MAPTSASLLGLPDELLLVIAKYLVVQPRFDRRGYKDITSLSVTHTRFSNVAREALQQTDTLSVSVTQIHTMVRTLIDFPDWMAQIKNLEITNYQSVAQSMSVYSFPKTYNDHFSTEKIWHRDAEKEFKRGRSSYQTIKRRARAPSRLFDMTFDYTLRNRCLELISLSNVSQKDKQQWSRALIARKTSAFIGSLLTMLPSLTGLYLGANHSMYHPMLFPIREPDDIMDSARTRERISQWQGADDYLTNIFQGLRSQWSILELPSCTAGMT